MKSKKAELHLDEHTCNIVRVEDDDLEIVIKKTFMSNRGIVDCKFLKIGDHIPYRQASRAVMIAEKDARERVLRALDSATEQYPKILQGFKNYFLSIYDNDN